MRRAAVSGRLAGRSCRRASLRPHRHAAFASTKVSMAVLRQIAVTILLLAAAGCAWLYLSPAPGRFLLADDRLPQALRPLVSALSSADDAPKIGATPTERGGGRQAPSSPWPTSSRSSRATGCARSAPARRCEPSPSAPTRPVSSSRCRFVRATRSRRGRRSSRFRTTPSGSPWTAPASPSPPPTTSSPATRRWRPRAPPSPRSSSRRSAARATPRRSICNRPRSRSPSAGSPRRSTGMSGS